MPPQIAPHAQASDVRVNPAGCPSCEAEYLTRSKEAEREEQVRLEQLRNCLLYTSPSPRDS